MQHIKSFLFLLALGVSLSCSAYMRAAPMLTGIKVWEYYKYENGAFRNYAVVINAQDTDVDVVILKTGNFYERPHKRVVQTDSPRSPRPIISQRTEYLPMTHTDSMRLGKPIIRPGDTLLTGIRLKRHEIRIIPDFFEQFRRMSDSARQSGERRKMTTEIRVMLNGKYSGGCKINQVTIPETIPRSGIVVANSSLSSGRLLPYYIHTDNSYFSGGREYKINVYVASSNEVDTIEIKPVPERSETSTFWGVKYASPDLLDTVAGFRCQVIGHESNSMGAHKLIRAKIPADIPTFSIMLKSPETKANVFTGFDLRYFRKGISAAYETLFPLNIKL